MRKLLEGPIRRVLACKMNMGHVGTKIGLCRAGGRLGESTRLLQPVKKFSHVLSDGPHTPHRQNTR